MVKYIIISLLLLSYVTAQCPVNLTQTSPCDCRPTRYEPVTLVCGQSLTLQTITSSIGHFSPIIDALLISKTRIDILPAFAFQSYRIKRLAITGGQMVRIDAQAFDGPLLNELEELDLDNNKMGAIPQEGISKLFNLRALILSNNNIASIAPAAFSNYQSRSAIKKLDLSSNDLRSLPSNAFFGLSSLEELNLNKNVLSRIPAAAFASIRGTLMDLSLGVNLIEEIPIGSLSLPNLKSLGLNVNKISSISSATFQETPNLVYLYLGSNRFTSINKDLFNYVRKLQVLSIANNAIDVLQKDVFSYIPNLIRLDLQECEIGSIEHGTFGVLKGLKKLTLRRNKLKEISKDMFEDLTGLYSLDLGGNRISFIENRAWANLRMLRHLDLSNNQIQSLENETFKGSFEQTNPPIARVLYLYDNPWLCDDRLLWLRNWLDQHADIQINAPGYPTTICFKPSYKYRQSFRNLTDPGPPPNGGTTTAPVGGTPLPYQTETKLGQFSIAAVVLGSILGILLLSIVLLAIVRYFVSKNRRRRKDDDEEARRFGSSISGYHSSYPVHPMSTIGDNFENDRNLTERQSGGQYFLNRPWYWWF